MEEHRNSNLLWGRMLGPLVAIETTYEVLCDTPLRREENIDNERYSHAPPISTVLKILADEHQESCCCSPNNYAQIPQSSASTEVIRSQHTEQCTSQKSRLHWVPLPRFRLYLFFRFLLVYHQISAAKVSSRQGCIHSLHSLIDSRWFNLSLR